MDTLDLRENLQAAINVECLSMHQSEHVDIGGKRMQYEAL